MTDTHNKRSAEDVLGTLTGWDEIAIAKKFGAEVLDLMSEKPLTGLRALLYIEKRRELDGTANQAAVDDAAYEACMGLTVKQVHDLISDEDDDEVFPDDPSTPAGKDEQPPSEPPSDLRPSAS